MVTPMTTGQLIAALQLADPSGNKDVKVTTKDYVVLNRGDEVDIIGGVVVPPTPNTNIHIQLDA
jgi:hypothetical protein